MIQIYRIEHVVTKVGPFQTSDVFTQDLAKKAGISRYLRSPGDDGLYLGFLPFCFVFGCKDLPSLKRWFFFGETVTENERIVDELKQRGFVLAEFLVDSEDYKVSASGIQVVFDADMGRSNGLVEYHDLSALLKESPLVFCIN